jgi:FkbM family methyltransferase
VLAAVVRRLGVQRAARRSYYWLFGGEGDVIQLRCGGISARFHAADAQEFRTVELALLSERSTIESLLSTLRPGDVFWDVGSNRGLFAIFAAKRVGSDGMVFAFEPESTCHAKLVANVHLNRLENVRALQCALSDRQGEGALTRAQDTQLSQGSRLVDVRSDDTDTVEVTTADSLNLPPPHVVKIDVEGHEYQALRGSQQVLSHPACRAIFCEVHVDRQPAGVSADAVRALIRSFGFAEVERHERGTELQIVGLKE